MIRYVAFLGELNASGGNPVTMDEVRKYFEFAGLEQVVVYGLAGTLLFDSKEKNEVLLTQMLEKVLGSGIGHKVKVVLRVYHELTDILKNNPFTTLKSNEKKSLYVTFLSAEPSFDVRGSLGVYSNDAEYARVVNREVYIVSKNYGKTCFSNPFIEKKLGVKATTRNWATISKLLEL